MIKRFPSSRSQRSKGIRVKHVLQVMLLLGVCFWLIYQVKHNHDKKKEFDKTDSKLSVRTETDHILKLGRKDLHPGKEEVNQNEKHEEEEEDEHIVEDAESKHEQDEQQQEEEGHKHETEESEVNIHEGREQEEEENKHEAEEQEEDESKIEEVEDEGGDAEIDENDHEKSDVDNDRDDEVIDEEKEKEEEGDETENEDKEDEEKGGLVENHDNHEAREEHYKGDDASSAVAHETHATSTETETETINLEHSGVNLAVNIRKPEIETTYSDESNKNKNDSDLKVTEGEGTDGISSNTTAAKETGNDSLSNETAKTNTDISSNLTTVITEASSNLTGNDMSSSSEQNKTAILSESDHAQNATATANTTIMGDIHQTEGSKQSGNKIAEENLPDNNSTLSVKPENGDAAPGESSTLRASELEKTIGFVALNGTENISSDLDRNMSFDTTESDKSKGSIETGETNETQNFDATEDEIFKGDTQTGATDEKSDSSSATTEISDSAEHDAIDSSDTHIHEDMEKARTDLDTMPDIRNEGNEDDENAAE